MSERYDHLEIEPKWQKFWEENKTFKAEKNTNKEKFYVLDMFPYPSGAGLHVGHPEGYTASDIVTRYMRMNNFEVLHPMGWDAFGLPAENYAIKTGIHPRIATEDNIKTFKRQIQSIGFSYDWDREIDSTDPAYFKWTQWIFMQFFNSYFDYSEQKAKPIAELAEKLAKEGKFDGLSKKEQNAILDDYRLAYEKEAPINFCPSCKTGLANEEVVDGKCERCGALVERKNLRQWILRITDYAERLLNDLNPASAFMIHGYGASSDSNFFPWALIEMNKIGFEAYNLDMPSTENPVYSEWKKYFEKNYADKVDEKSVLIGHSLGGSFILRYLAETEQKVDLVILVAPAKTDCGISEISNFFEKDLDFAKIKKNVRKIVLLGSDNDQFIPKKDFDDLVANLGAEFVFLPSRGHLMEPTLPELLPYLKKAGQDVLDWPEKIRLMQKNWIGRSVGAEVDFEINSEKVRVFTTRPDTLFGATYFVLSPEHPLVEKITTPEQKEAVENYIKKSQNKSDLERTELNKEKTGEFTGTYAVNPVNGEKIPVWIADYVLMSYGTGAIMAVPAHDERDFEFAQKFNLPIIEVVKAPSDFEGECFCGEGVVMNSGFLDGLKTKEAKEKIIEWLVEKNLGEKAINYKIRDWIFSRQRYWGEPIPVVHCEKCGTVSLAEKDLPLELPQVEKYEPSGTGESPLINIDEWVNTVCPSCGGFAKRETNTMPQWAGSSWYWLRFMDANNNSAFCSVENEDYWGPVDLYVGGAEHAVLHLLYSRFWHKLLFDLNYVHTREPFKALRNQGMILAEDGQKMSKSLGNVVNPDDIIKQYGADTLRVYEMFMGPFEQAKAWSTSSVEGVYKFLQRIWRLYTEKEIVDEKADDNLERILHKTIKKVSEDIPNFKFNTAVSQMMIFTNEAGKYEKLPKKVMETFILLVSPFAPHLAEEIWREILGNSKTIAYENWPLYNAEIAKDDEIELAVQVNGRLRATIMVSAEISRDEALKIACEHEKIQKWIEDKEIIKEIFVPGKLVNLVIKE